MNSLIKPVVDKFTPEEKEQFKEFIKEAEDFEKEMKEVEARLLQQLDKQQKLIDEAKAYYESINKKHCQLKTSIKVLGVSLQDARDKLNGKKTVFN